MARKKRSKAGKPSMLSVVREIMKANPAASAPEIVALAQSNFGVEIPPRTAGVYRYQVLNPKKGKKRKYKLKAMQEPVAPAARTASPTEGYEDLFRAAEKLGWKKLKDVVQKITQAPH